MAHPLSGADIVTLRRVMAEADGIDRRWRALGIWAAALGRLPFTTLECILAGPRLPATSEMAPPVFILGHWRSGTTHLYNVMSLGGFGYVPPLAAGLPWDMFGLARVLRPLLERQLPARRFIDDIPVTPTSPQEDEIAMANMSPLSFYHGIYFPRDFDRLIDRGIFFKGCTDDEVRAWERRFTYLMRRLALHQGRRLLIKNPVYTARPATLARLFPGAKFIHIHRNPFDVFLSMRNFYARLLEVMALQDVPADLDVDATILRVYRRMMTAFEAQTSGWGRPDFIELSYAELDADPMTALEWIYDGLGLAGFADAAPRFRSYLEGARAYRRHDFRGDVRAVELVGRHLGRWIEKWGYDVPGPIQAAS